MAGVSVDGPSGGRRNLDSEINMIPMIDLLMVTVSFLLITAVWSQMARLDASARAPGDHTEPVDPPKPEVSLHVRTAGEDKFVLEWREGNAVISSRDVVRHENVTEVRGVRIVRYPELAKAIEEEWKVRGVHRDLADAKSDRAVMHTPHEMHYSSMIAVMDAIATPGKGMVRGTSVPAFTTTLATD
jgi:biopolymer transport protein ExbD